MSNPAPQAALLSLTMSGCGAGDAAARVVSASLLSGLGLLRLSLGDAVTDEGVAALAWPLRMGGALRELALGSLIGETGMM